MLTYCFVFLNPRRLRHSWIHPLKPSTCRHGRIAGTRPTWPRHTPAQYRPSPSLETKCVFSVRLRHWRLGTCHVRKCKHEHRKRVYYIFVFVFSFFSVNNRCCQLCCQRMCQVSVIWDFEDLLSSAIFCQKKTMSHCHWKLIRFVISQSKRW